MPGIDKSRFTNLSKDVEELLCCEICSAIFVDPVVTPCCRQTYCQTCIKQWLQQRKTCPSDKQALTPNKLIQPPRLVINLLNRLIIKCNFQVNGCAEEISFNRYKQHVRSCRFNPEAKCVDCGKLNGERNGHNCVEILVAKTKSLEANNKKLRRETERLKNTLADKRESLFEKNEKLSDANRELDKIDKELAETSDKLNETIREQEKQMLDEKTKTVVELKELNNKLIEKIKKESELLEKLREKNVLIEKFKNFSGLLNEQNQTLEKEKQVLRQRVNSLIEIKKRVFDLRNDVLKIETSFGELKNGEQNSSVSMSDDKTPVSFVKTIRLNTLTNFSYTDHYRSNIFTTINGLQWKIRTTIVKESDLDYLGFYLICIGGGDHDYNQWSCKSTVEFSITQQIDKLVKYSLKYKHTFTNDQHICGYPKFMPWSIICDKSIGYVKDDHIILEVVISF